MACLIFSQGAKSGAFPKLLQEEEFAQASAMLFDESDKNQNDEESVDADTNEGNSDAKRSGRF